MSEYRLESLDKLFGLTDEAEESTQPAIESTPEPQSELCTSELRDLPITSLKDFSTGMQQQPFHAYSQADLELLQQSISAHGIIQPLVVRPLGRGTYEIISGHNRRTAALSVGYTTVPCLVRELSDDEAIMQMCSTNLQQRQGLLPSEKAWAYKLQLDAMKRQGARTDLTSRQAGAKSRADEQLANGTEDSARTIQRYIRLTELIPALLTAVDEKRLGLNVGVTLSYLRAENQRFVAEYCMDTRKLCINQGLASQLRQADEINTPFTPDMLEQLMQPSESPVRAIILPYEAVQSYFSEDTSKQTIEQTIQQALQLYFTQSADTP